MVPDLLPEEEPADLLGRRDIDLNYDQIPYIGKYNHEDFTDGSYWDYLKTDQFRNNKVKYIPQKARNTLNRE